MQQEKKYQPALCEHKLPNGLGSWMFHSESSGSGPDMYHSVHVSVCLLCGTIRVGGFRQSKGGKMNRFNEEFSIHATEAIDAMVKYANYIHEEEVWGRSPQHAGTAVWVKGGPKEMKPHYAKVPSKLYDHITYKAIIIPKGTPGYWWAVGDGFAFSLTSEEIIEHLDESESPSKEGDKEWEVCDFAEWLRLNYKSSQNGWVDALGKWDTTFGLYQLWNNQQNRNNVNS